MSTHNSGSISRRAGQAASVREPLRFGWVAALTLACCNPAGGALNPTDWQPETAGAYGGRSELTNGALLFWTEHPLAQPADDVDDQQILYFEGFVPRSGPYELLATVHLPATLLTPHDPAWEVVPFYALGMVASGLVVPGPAGELPALRAAIVYEDLPEYGVQAGDMLILWEDSENGPPQFLRLNTVAESIDLRIAFDGVALVEFFYRPSGEAPWHSVATRAVQLRPGLNARAELLGQSANLLVARAAGGMISDFQVGFARPRITSLVGNAATGDWTLAWGSEVAAVYSVWGSPDLQGWTELDSNRVGTGEELRYVHRPSLLEPHYFFRVRRH